MVCVLLGSGFEETEAVVPIDLLRRGGVEVALVSLEGEIVPSSHQVPIMADMTLSQVDPDTVELVFLPGGLGGVKALGADPRVARLVRLVLDRGGYAAAICAGPTILAHLGIADRRRAVCYPGMEEEMGSAVVQKGQRVVADGHMITAEAAGSAFEFGLKLVEALKDKDAAQKVKQAVHYR